MTSLVELIAKKRDGRELSTPEIRRFIQAYLDGELADYQMSAFLMAVFLRGMTDLETVALTQAMLHSGTVIDLAHVPGVKVDKHSTGGVGDKVSICLAPLVAACGVPVPMVSGRGLGHTGGTLDKLEAIPGFNVNLGIPDYARIVRDVGTCMIGQTSDIAPADKRIYALRDVTATVESIPLIVASILSKKLAEGIDALVLDVKVGRGAFMKNLDDARALATALVRVGSQAGKRVVAVLTRMDAPLGRAVGNALETREAIELLHRRAPMDLVECTNALAVEMLLVGQKARSRDEALRLIAAAIDNGSAIRTMEKMIEAQGGDPSVVRNPERLARAPVVVPLHADRAGWVAGIDALEIGLSAVQLGAGRLRAEQTVDPAVGIMIDTPIGTRIKAGSMLAELHVQSCTQAESVCDRVRGAFQISDAPPPPTALIMDRIENC